MNKIEEAMEGYWGKRCPDYEQDCPCCKAWDELDILKMEGLRKFPLWYAVGLGGVYYGTKKQCEKDLRKAFPDEDPDTRYARVFYKTFYEETL